MFFFFLFCPGKNVAFYIFIFIKDEKKPHTDLALGFAHAWLFCSALSIWLCSNFIVNTAL